MGALELKAGEIVSARSLRAEEQMIPADTAHIHELFSVDDLRTLASAAELLAVMSATELAAGNGVAFEATARLTNAVQIVVISLAVSKGLVAGFTA